MSDVVAAPDSGQSATFGYRVAYRPAFALATLMLAPEQPIKTQAGAMVSMSANIELESKMEGGVWGALKRSVGGRTAFVSTYTARGGPGELTLAPAVPGDIVPVVLSGDVYNVAASCYLASEAALDVNTGWGGARSFFASDNMFVLQLSGAGMAFVTSYGALHTRTLAPGEEYIVDTGHLVAWHAEMPYQITKATSSFIRSLTSGEMLVARFSGPGTLLLQTRNLHAFADVLQPLLPSTSTGSD